MAGATGGDFLMYGMVALQIRAIHGYSFIYTWKISMGGMQHLGWGAY